ncbi:MAG TPA: hypothetical protein VIX81_09550 [Gammaproteobacteria bacterium]
MARSIQGRPRGLMLIYPQGNHITASPETPLLQIGGSKYGKPTLERSVNPALSLEDGARPALVSLDASWRPNITVGPPFEVGLCRGGSLQLRGPHSYGIGDPFLGTIREQWNNGIRRAYDGRPRFPWAEAVTLPVSLVGGS